MSLRWKILGWFFINLAVVGLLVSGFLFVQFRIGMTSLIAGPTDDRLEAIAQPLAAELRRLPENQWSTALDGAAALWRSRGVRMALYRGHGEFVAGEIKTLPPAVTDEMERREAQMRHGPRDHHGGPPPGGFPGPGGPQAVGVEHPERHLPPPGGPPPSSERDDRPPKRPFTPEDFPPGAPHDAAAFGSGAPPVHTVDSTRTTRLSKFMLVAGHPRLYWTGVYLGEVRGPGHGGPKPPVTLLLTSPTLSAGGLFFDYVPWLVLGTALVAISVLWWLPFVHGLTRSLADMTEQAEEIARGQFSSSPVTKRRDELGRLGRALTHMSARLNGYVTGQKRFLGDTSHELLSPLARLEVALSILEQKIHSPADRQYVDRSLGEVREMSRLVNDLLAYTKAGLRAQSADVRPVHVARVAREAAAREANGETVLVEVPEDCRVCADPDLLLRALANGIRNAVRYAAAGGADCDRRSTAFGASRPVGGGSGAGSGARGAIRGVGSSL